MKTTLQTARLVLRPLCAADAQTFYAYAGDADTAKYMLFLYKESLEQAREHLLAAEREWAKPRPDFFEFAVTLSGAHIGSVSLYREHDGEGEYAELGWEMNSRYRGFGYAPEAAAALIPFALEQGFTRILADCDYRNKPSERVMQKIGMTLLSDSGTRTYPRTGETVRSLCYIYRKGE